MPRKSHRQAQDIASTVYTEARKIALRSIGSAIDQLEALTAADAAKMKRELRALFKLSGIPERRAGKIIDDVLKASRAKRAKVVEDSIKEAARAARGVDEATFKVVFGGDPAAAGPFVPGRSGSSPIAKRSLQLVSASEDDSTETD